MTEYENWSGKLTGRNANSRKLANNTYVERRGSDIAIRLHSTDILTFKPDGAVAVTSGGWQTPTTKDRLNAYLPAGFSIHQKKGLWYWNDGTHFAEGDSLAPTGNGGLRLVTQAPLNGEDTQKALRKRINAYAALAASKVPLDKPGSGDCWYCHLVGQDGKNMGDAFGDTAHLTAHMDEGYVVPSLAFKALKESGNGDVVLAAAFGEFDAWEELARERVKRSVAKYMRRRLGLP